ncbi:MAG: hypothetical protein N2203_00300 [Bacteroidia bacterium]|nr:hypothetical protein [Bacteroidia bacterium]
MKKPLDKTIDIKILSFEGSILYGKTKMNPLTIETPYGKLIIPLKDVVQIIFGLEKDEKISSEINKYIKILANSSNKKIIDTSLKNISNYGLKAIYYLENYLIKNSFKNKDNIQSLINEILTVNNLNISDIKYEDTIVLNNGDKITGNIDIKTIDFSNNFLKAIIPRSNIKTIDISYFDKSEGIYLFHLKANKHILANTEGGWLNTNIKVKKGQIIDMSANGEIVLESLDNKKFTPNGNVVGEKQKNENSADPNYFSYGTLIFKIGDNGKYIKAGNKVRYVADTDDIIYLTIYETVYSNKNSGSYQVKILLK